MPDWTINVVRVPIVIGGQNVGFHNSIVIRDNNGVFYAEINGGPRNPTTGELIFFNSPAFQAITAYTSGTYNVGAQVYTSPALTSGLGLGTTVFSGSQSEILARLDAAAACAAQINASDEKYSLLTGPVLVDRETGETAASYNSNSVAATTLECMGLNPSNPAFSNSGAPGSRDPIIPQSDVREIIEQQNLTAPPGNQIPFPPDRQSETIDHPDGSHDVATRDEAGNLLALSRYEASGDLIRTEEHFADGSMSVSTLTEGTATTTLTNSSGQELETIAVDADHAVTLTTFDPSDQQTYSERTITFDAQGRTDSVDTVNDDGSETATGYDDDGNPTWSFEQNADGSGEFSDPDGTHVSFDEGELTDFSVGPDGSPTMSFDTDGGETDLNFNGDGTGTVSKDGEGEIGVPGGTDIRFDDNGTSVDRIDPGSGDPGPGDPGPNPGPGDPGSGPGPHWPLSQPTPPVDPLVLDLDGDGIELISVLQSQAHFDFDGDGFAEKTGWAAANDGFLVRDANANGTVDGVSELFGNEVVDGFTALEGVDANHDGKIDSADSAFAQLRVWRDLNGNGVSNTGELSTLAAAGVSSISLTRVATDETIAGNRIGFTGSFTRTDSSTGTVVAAFFQTDRTLTQWIPPQGFEFSPDVWGLPGVKGYGQLPDLKYAMTLDADLLADVRAFALAGDTMSGGQLRTQFELLLFEWAGVENVSPTSRGPNVDGRHLAFLEKFFGASITQDTGGGPSSNPNGRFGAELERNYTLVSNGLLTRFLSSVPATEFLLGENPLEAFDSPLLPLSGLRYHARSDGFGGDITQVLADAFEAVPAASQAAVEYIDRMVAAIAGAQTDFFGNDRSAFQTAVSAAWDAAGGSDQALLEYTLLITGAAPALTGAAGGGTIQGGSANDVLMGRQGNDQLTGNWGDDVYVYARGGGNDVVADGSFNANDRLLLPGINPSDVTLSRITDSEHLTLIRSQAADQ